MVGPFVSCCLLVCLLLLASCSWCLLIGGAAPVLAKTTMMLLAALAAAAVTAVEVGPGPVIPDPAWNDTACHEPSEEGCRSCCEPQPPGSSPAAGAAARRLQTNITIPWVRRAWTGNCTGAPCPRSPRGACAPPPPAPPLPRLLADRAVRAGQLPVRQLLPGRAAVV